MKQVFYLLFGVFFMSLIIFGTTKQSFASGGEGGGSSDSVTFGPPESSVSESSVPEGFNGSPAALKAYNAAGGKSGTGLSFPKWLEKTRKEWESEQASLTWDAKKAGWKAGAWNVSYYGAQGANYAGKAAQFGLNFVPGFGWVSVSLDAARGGAEGYAEAVEKGLDQKDAVQVGVKSGVAQGIMSAGFNKFGLGNRFGTDKAVNAFKGAKTAKQTLKATKALKKAIIGNVIDTGVQEYVGNEHISNTIENSSPQPNIIQ